MLITSELTHENARKVLFTCVVYTKDRYSLQARKLAMEYVQRFKYTSGIFSSGDLSKESVLGLLTIERWLSTKRVWLPVASNAENLMLPQILIYCKNVEIANIFFAKVVKK